jgi:hypothetical protein|nr:MAG TPA: hypothetical protein [Caudoviricetes sp.]
MSIETKFNEVRKVTSEPKEMLNQFIAKRVLKTWKEDFVDEDTDEVTTIERNEVLFERSIFIDQDVLAQIKFYMSAGDIKEIEVSNQKRAAFHIESTYMHPYTAQADIAGKNKKFLFYSNTFDNALALLKDYIELNYREGFMITGIKEFNSCIILTDTLKKFRSDLPFEEWDSVDPDDEDDEESPENKKFYKIECKIQYEEDLSLTQLFVVHTFNVDRAMFLINKFLKDQEETKKQEAIEHGREYHSAEYHTMIETASPLNAGCFIPKEFSQAYCKDSD